MIVKVHSTGAGRGSGPVGYLLGEDLKREGATLDRGDPDQTQELIDSSPYAKKYTSGVLSFQESDLSREVKDKIMSSFERALVPGLDSNQYSCLWVEHRDKGRLELNFVVPNVELQTGKRLQPYFDKADRPRIDAWKTATNAHYKLHDPNDPMNKRELTTPRNLPQSKQQAAQTITDSLLSLAGNGNIKNRQDVVKALESAGFSVARKTKTSISIADPDGGRNIRLKGMLYEQNFRFGKELRGEIEAASERYRAESQERIQQAREVYQRGFEIKRAENQKRYSVPEPENQRATFERMALDGNQRDPDFMRLLGSDLAPRSNDIEQLHRDKSAKHDPQKIGIGGRQAGIQQMRRQDVFSGSQGFRDVGKNERQETDVHTRGILEDDGVGETVIERIRELAETTRSATQRLRRGLQKLGKNVQSHFERERHVTRASHKLERAGRAFERSTTAVRSEISRDIALSRLKSPKVRY